MATIHVKDVPDDIYEAVKRRAATAGRSLASEVRRLLEQAASEPGRPLAEVVRSIDRLRRKHEGPGGKVDVDGLLAKDRSR